jgi:hypothetical protein
MENDKIVLICASGRSGSTTLQRILNSIPNSNICGENMGAINSLLEFYKRLKTTSFDYVPGHLNPTSYDTIISKNIKPSWYNSYNFKQIAHQIRTTIRLMFKNNDKTVLWGFKEIRYDGKNNNYISLIKEFIELFPKTKVIIHIREDISKQSKSSWLAQDKNSFQYLKNLHTELITFYYENRRYCYLSTFEKMFDINSLKQLFTFIDCSEHFKLEKLIPILNNNLKD